MSEDSQQIIKKAYEILKTSNKYKSIKNRNFKKYKTKMEELYPMFSKKYSFIFKELIKGNLTNHMDRFTQFVKTAECIKHQETHPTEWENGPPKEWESGFKS